MHFAHPLQQAKIEFWTAHGVDTNIRVELPLARSHVSTLGPDAVVSRPLPERVRLMQCLAEGIYCR